MKVAMNRFSYLGQRILDAPLLTDPFPHIELRPFLSDEDLALVLGDWRVHFPPVTDVWALVGMLATQGYKVQQFPGCTTNLREYLEGRERPGDAPTEGRGVTFRLHDLGRLQPLIDYLNGHEFHAALCRRFGIDEPTRIGTSIQKNLSGYEISPHPDVRRKALTYLVNINRDDEIGQHDVHTQLLEFKPQYAAAAKFWESHPDVDRCWVPWDWCLPRKQIRGNNTLLAFAPADAPPTLHAIKLDYDHCQWQRTQLYGSLLYTQRPFSLPQANWRHVQQWLQTLPNPQAQGAMDGPIEKP